MQRFDNFCFTGLWSIIIIQVLCAQLWYSGKGFTGWQLPAKREFLRMVDQGNLTSGSFWQKMEEFDCHMESQGTSIPFVVERMNKVVFSLLGK